MKTSTATATSGENLMIANSSMAFTITVSDSSNIFEIGSLTFFVVVGAAGGIFSLVVIILILCITVSCLVLGTETSPPYTTTAPVQVQLQSQGTSVHSTASD